MGRGSEGSALEIVKIYQATGRHRDRVVEHLKMVSESAAVSEAEREEATSLLGTLNAERAREQTPRRRRNARRRSG